MRNVYEAGGKELIELLNKYPQAVFTWGHNHSEADPCYGTVRFPGETINYGPKLEDSTGIHGMDALSAVKDVRTAMSTILTG